MNNDVEIITLPKPYINMDNSINEHLVNILNQGLDDLEYNSPSRFSTDNILMIYKKDHYLEIDYPGDVDILYCETQQSGQFIHFVPPSSSGDLKVVPDQRATKALNYIKDYYRDNIIVYPYTIKDNDMRYDIENNGDITTVVVYGNNGYLPADDFVLLNESAQRGKVLPQYFYDGLKNVHSDTTHVVGYYDTGHVDDRGFPVLENIETWTFKNT